jgi:transposase-like protein
VTASTAPARLRASLRLTVSGSGSRQAKRRSNVVGMLPHRASLIRLIGMVLAEQDDEWAVTVL